MIENLTTITLKGGGETSVKTSLIYHEDEGGGDEDITVVCTPLL